MVLAWSRLVLVLCRTRHDFTRGLPSASLHAQLRVARPTVHETGALIEDLCHNDCVTLRLSVLQVSRLHHCLGTAKCLALFLSPSSLKRPQSVGTASTSRKHQTANNRRQDKKSQAECDHKETPGPSMVSERSGLRVLVARAGARLQARASPPQAKGMSLSSRCIGVPGAYHAAVHKNPVQNCSLRPDRCRISDDLDTEEAECVAMMCVNES